jgi:hypothetical protein
MPGKAEARTLALTETAREAPRRFADPKSGVNYADFAMISSAILRGTGS